MPKTHLSPPDAGSTPPNASPCCASTIQPERQSAGQRRRHADAAWSWRRIIAIDSSGTRSTGQTLVDFAREEEATCLLIGAFKHSYFLELLLGRITRYVLRTRPMPVMIKH
jgi:hypothetical protein